MEIDFNPTRNNSLCPLAIAFTYPFSPSETFIRTHVEHLAPGATLALNFGSLADGDLVDHVLLTGRRSTGNVVKRKIEGLMTFARTGSRFGLSRESMRKATDLLVRHKCNRIFVEYGDLALAVAPIARAAGCKIGVQFHGFDMSSFVKLPGIPGEYKRLFPQLDRVIAGSRYLAQRAIDIGCPADIIRIVPYGIDTELFEMQSRERVRGRRFVAIGRLTPKKAPQLTIEAFRIVLDEFPDATLDIIGDGELRGSCESVIKHHGISGSVKLHGAQSPIYIKKILADSDVFVQHSVVAEDGDVESFGISLVEAMATGIPVVATNHNGFPDTVADKETGFLVPEHDVDAMAEKLLLLLREPDLAAKMGQAGSRRAREKFDFRNTIPRLRDAIGYNPG